MAQQSKQTLLVPRKWPIERFFEDPKGFYYSLLKASTYDLEVLFLLGSLEYYSKAKSFFKICDIFTGIAAIVQRIEQLRPKE